jgi:ADP-heptose:LPS heptosyltransferase
MKDKTPHNSQWVIVTFNRPVMWTRNEDEVWMFTPKRRYVLNANQLGNLGDYIHTISDLRTSAFYKPLMAGQATLAGSNVLIERYRERGIGDLLFLTGPMNYLKFLSGGEVNIDAYALADRGVILANHPALQYKATLAGPLQYDDLQHYDYHWFVDTATEYDEEPDQLNVYDALYKTLGLDPATVPSDYKRPNIVLEDADIKNLDQFLYFTWLEKKLDLRKSGYYVIAPLARGSLRAASYQMWLDVINQLKTRRPVVVVGSLDGRVPTTDMEAGEFNQHVSQAGPNVVNALRSPPMPLRVLASIISRATAVGCLDSGPLYVAQSLRVPAVSVWGPHDPGVRIGYDQDYMNLAVWSQDKCRRCPCYCYDRFPAEKCPQGAEQKICEPLRTTNPGLIVKKFEEIESKNVPVALIPQK